jgi:hypothetical protein
MSCSDCPEVFELCVNEGAQKDYIATLLDKAGTAVPLASLTDITLTLKDVATGAIVNSRDAQSQKNAGNGTYHATSGLFTMSFQPDDAAIVNASSISEKKIATFLATWSGGGQHQWDVIVKVKNLGKTN